ncbi:MAG: hypothetical protein JWR77_1101 [Rhizorhabdus sp.]|nr:hypothetical protein [Rhizorhabdus sp.]
MRLARWMALLAVLAAPTSAMAAPVKPKAAAKQDWLKTISRTPEGAIVVGNPAAKVKLIEYLSLTCPHCAVMSGETMAPLQRDYIAKGLVSFEVRHAVRDGYDFVASLLARCAPPATYLGSIEGLFATQQQWMTKAMAAAEDPGFDAKTPEQKMATVSHIAGFDSYFAGRGLPPARYAACLADLPAQKQLGEMAGFAWDRDKIPGTPAFMINGTMAGSLAHWSELEAKLAAAAR